jgi:L-malate glycosyltransferase
MRILQICSAREIGGGEKHLADLSNELARRGQDVFAALSPGSPVRAELSQVPADRILELPMRNALNLSSAMKLKRVVREHEIDIVHAHVARDYPVAALAAGGSRAKLVLTRHVLFPLNPIHKLTLRRTSRVIAVSQAVADSLNSQTIFAPDKITLIYNGIDFRRFESLRKRDSEKKKRRVGTIGHLAPIKGPDDFIRTAARIFEQRADVEFVIAGADKSSRGENRTNLEKLIAELGVNDQIKLPGWIEDIPELLATFDLFVSPARAEPFGLSIVEAMAAGVPVIATASEGAREIIQDRETGRLVPIGDTHALAEAIRDLLDNPAERERLAQNAQRDARTRFSLSRMVDRTEQVYTEVTAGG